MTSQQAATTRDDESRCEWCGEPADDELGPIHEVGNERYHGGCHGSAVGCADPEAHDAHMAMNGECPWCGEAATR